MIDYQKLQLAHKLAEKCGSSIVYAYQDVNKAYVHWVSLDQLFLEMQELMRSKPKYKVGQTVYVRLNQSVYSFKIDEIEQDEEIYYIHKNKDGGFSHNGEYFDQYPEKNLYPTREELIKSQIDYWQGMKESPITLKCPKCGCLLIDNGRNWHPDCDYLIEWEMTE